jgi:hypothetical protein
VDGIELALITVLDQREGLQGSHFHWIVARTGRGDGSRVQQQMQRIFRHEFPFSVTDPC